MSLPWWAIGGDPLQHFDELPLRQIWPVPNDDIWPGNVNGQLPNGLLDFPDERATIAYRISYFERQPVTVSGWPVDGFDTSWPMGMPTFVYINTADAGDEYDDENAVRWRYYDEAPEGFRRITDFDESADPINVAAQLAFGFKYRIEVKYVFIPLRVTYYRVLRNDDGDVIEEGDEEVLMNASTDWILDLEPSENEEFFDIRVYRALPFRN